MTLPQEYSPHTTAPTLAVDIAALYERTRARMGAEDLAHIRNVAAYSQAIKQRSRALLQEGGAPRAFRHGVVLYALHTLLEFSELGHNILHGSYDHLPDCGEFHSDRWQWDMNVDPREWKVMHHQNHHPHTNIIDKDHDLGYSILRLQPGQDWFGHHAAQLALVAPALFATIPFFFGAYTASSAARTEGRSVLRPSTFRAVTRLVARQALRDYVREPIAAGRRALHTLAGNALGVAAGHLAVALLVALEHHTPNVEVFHDPGPEETPDQYFERQIRSTTNFEPSERLDRWLQNILAEVDYPNPPDFRIFYGGLDTHLEHHLFPDLPPNRQREIAEETRGLCERHGLLYNMFAIDRYVPMAAQKLSSLALPVGEREGPNPLKLLRKPIDTARRLAFGSRFRRHPDEPYLRATKFFNAQAKVVSAREEADGQARCFRIAKPRGWDHVAWRPGAFVSVRVPVGGEALVRQYSLVHDSDSSDHFEICVKRVAGGRASNYLNDALREGKRITLVGPPTSGGPFVMDSIPQQLAFIAGGVGITPIISMLRAVVREAPDADAVLLYFNHDERAVIFDREIRELAKSARIRVERFTTGPSARGGSTTQGRLCAELLAREIDDLARRDVYVCAPPGMVDLARKLCADSGVPEHRFHTESFAPPVLQRPAGRADQRHTVRFQRSGSEIEVDGQTTLLEAARAAGVDVPTGCEQGLCRACVTGKLRGFVQDEDKDNPQTRITVCNSLPVSDIALDL
ncbi:MAG: FAD-binding oxidoreductase [Segniliparus sp.]|uniref:FAD-binding oxidoreductase n=1 Tax=Segniliparus sp. TaxID=2804064 RepID=UPI003F392EB3